MTKKALKFLLLASYFVAVFGAIFLHGYFAYNGQSFSSFSWYWWLLSLGIIMIILRWALPFKLVYALGLALFVSGGVIRIFSTIGEILVSLSFIVIVLSIFSIQNQK